MNIALVHDFLTQFGGAERVLSAIHEIWPDAPVYTSVYDSDVILTLRKQWKDPVGVQDSVGFFPLDSARGQNDSRKSWDIHSSFLQTLPPARWFSKYFTFLVPLAFEGFDLSDYDVVISSSANFAKGVLTRPHQLHICYCHTPPRFLYHYPTETNKRSHFFWGPVLRPLDNYLRIWDYLSAQRVDFFVANSNVVASRIKKFYRKEARVIYPPVEVQSSKFKVQSCNSKLKVKEVDLKCNFYFLVVSRLSRYKNVDLAVQVSNCLKFPLKVVGVGREEKSLRKMAGPTVQFLGTVSDRELANLYQNCQAVIFPAQDEDFGIVPVEAMSFGKPVIALRSGGVIESVVEGKTGVFFEESTVDSLVAVLCGFDTTLYKSSDCKDQAKKFSKERFQREFRELVESRWAEFQVEKGLKGIKGINYERRK